MNVAKLKLWIVLMAVALIAIVCIQSYWITNAYQLERRNFDTAVKKAMAETAVALEEQMDAEDIVKEIAVMFPNSPELVALVNNEFEHDTVISLNGENTTFDLTSRSRKIGDTLFQNQSKVIITRGAQRTQIGELEEDVIYHINDEGHEVTHLDKSTNQKSRARLFWKASKALTGYEKRIDGKEVFTVLKEKLANNGIRDSVQLVIEVGDSIIYRNGSTGIDMQSYNHQTDLFPGQFGPSQTKILGYFPNNTWQPLKGLVGLIVISLLSIATVLGGLIFSIQTILRQKKLSEIRNDFINNMTHEFKTPLATISMAADASESLKLGSEQGSHYNNVIKEESKKLNSHVEAILETANLDANALEMQMECHNLEEVVQQVVNRFDLTISELKGQVRVRYIGNTETHFDAWHVERVIYNLVDNAVKYCSTKPEIDIIVEELVDSISFSIKDNGIGIRKADQHKVFDKFFRVPTGDVHTVKGFGIGLYYVRSIIEKHNGHYALESALGSGTTISFTIPKSTV